MLARQFAHEGTLADRGEADEANTGYTRPGHVEPGSAATSSTRRRQQFSL